MPAFFAGGITQYLRRTTFSAWRRKRSPSILHHRWPFVQPSRRRAWCHIAKVNAPPPLREVKGGGDPCESKRTASPRGGYREGSSRHFTHSPTESRSLSHLIRCDYFRDPPDKDLPHPDATCPLADLSNRGMLVPFDAPARRKRHTGRGGFPISPCEQTSFPIPRSATTSMPSARRFTCVRSTASRRFSSPSPPGR